LTLDGFYTQTTVHFQEHLSEDVFFLDEQKMSGEPFHRVTRFLDVVRGLAGKEELFAEVHSVNKVPTAAGFASSASGLDRKSTRLNSSHVSISYAVFCLKKKTNKSVSCAASTMSCQWGHNRPI